MHVYCCCYIDLGRVVLGSVRYSPQPMICVVDTFRFIVHEVTCWRPDEICLIGYRADTYEVLRIPYYLPRDIRVAF